MQPVDYSKLRLNNINSPEYSHIKLLLFWPLFGLAFSILERFICLDYHIIHCSFDDLIPFCEFFVIPYYFWFLFIIGMLLYSFFYDVAVFKKFMKFIILTYSVSLIIYIVYPTKQMLRPEDFSRDNVFIRVVRFLYGFDTNTNVCPSMHVIGSMAVYFAARKSKLFSGRLVRCAFLITAVIISVSTVFLKQHSILDIVWAVVVSIGAYPITFKGAELFHSRKKQYI